MIDDSDIPVLTLNGPLALGVNPAVVLYNLAGRPAEYAMEFRQLMAWCDGPLTGLELKQALALRDGTQD